MEFSVDVEKKSSILRQLTVKVPAKEVKNRFERGLVEVQKTAKLKGFRPGQAPIAIIKQFYGEDVRHRVFHNLIDESFENAVRDQKLWTVGSPKIDTPDHQTGQGAHDHTLKEDQDLTYIATVEVMPEIEAKGYTGVSVNQEKVSITEEQIEKVVKNLADSQAQLVPVEGGLTLADGTQSSRPVQKGDFADTAFKGGMVTESGVAFRDDMTGNQVLEIGSGTFIPGFEDQMIGMRRGETKTFRIQFPADYGHKEFASKDAEFTVTLNELKEKKLPTLDDEFAKQLGYEGLADLRTKAKEFITKNQTEESDRKVRSELLATIIEKNSFEVPVALVEGQTRALAQDWAQELKKQGFKDQMIQEAITAEIESLKKRAESQVRASLILESIAKQEKIAVSEEELNSEMQKIADASKVEMSQLLEFYAKNPGRRDDLEFRLRQERTFKFLLDKAKIKSVEPKDK
jgi:trigger factor